MALTHRITRRIDLPDEPGAWIDVRMPSLAIKDRARQARSRQVIQMISGIDLSQIKGMASERQEADGSEYDWQTLLASCVTAWSYEDPVTPENVAELDEATVSVILAALLPAESEGERKNGSGGSTTHSKVRELRRRNG